MSLFDKENPVNEKVLLTFGFEERHHDGKIVYLKTIHLYAALIFNPQTSDMFFTYIEKNTRKTKVLKVGHIADTIDLECIIEKYEKISWGKN